MKKIHERTKFPEDWTFFEIFQYFFFQYIFIFLGLFPIAFLVQLGHFVGVLLFMVAKKRKQIIFNNLNAVYGNHISKSKKETIAFKSFVMLFEDALVLNKCFFMEKRKILKLSRRINEHYLSDELKKGKGAILLGAHISHFTLGIGIIGLLGYKLCVAVRPFKSRPAEKLFKEWRLYAGVESFDQNKRALAIARHLAKGGAMWLALDQNARTNIIVDFLGRPATTFSGPVKLARQFGIPIIPVFTHRVGPAMYEIQFKSPIRLEKKRNISDEETAKDLRKLVDVIETQIYKYPEEWFWLHRRWKSADKLLAQKTCAQSSTEEP